jgi:hypothetical protein
MKACRHLNLRIHSKQINKYESIDVELRTHNLLFKKHDAIFSIFLVRFLWKKCVSASIYVDVKSAPQAKHTASRTKLA